jgi:LuxR family transcriptional regulator, maltose regulon positive regulatory protein
MRRRLAPRPRLLSRLNDFLEHKLILLSAPAGFGKTTLLSTWVQEVDLPASWLSLDEADNDPVRFLSYLIAALQQIDPAIGQELQSALATSQRPPVDAVIAALINELLALQQDFLLVLDDFHVIDDATIHAAIHTLVAHQPPQMHLIIATREDPQLPLARLRALGQLVELRGHDLRFTPQEVAFFLKEIMGLALDPQTIDQLDAQIEGWIAGLQLAALSMQNRENPAELVSALSGSHHFILGYLTEEVLRRLSPDIQSFLLETPVLNRLTGSLCDTVTGRTGSDRLLEEPYSSNIFVIPLDDEHLWYRYHHLFADLLRSQNNRTQPQLAPILHLRASAWYALQGNATDAIEHAFAATDYPTVVRLLQLARRHTIHPAYIDRLLAVFPDELLSGPPPQPELVEPLNEQANNH